MKKRKILKCATLCAMVAIVLVTAILPSFAWSNSGDASNRANCVFVYNGKENKFKTTCNSGLIVTNRIPIATGPTLYVWSDTGSITNSYFMQEHDYIVYLRMNDNEQIVELSVYDPNSDSYTYYDALTSTVYFFYEGTRQPTIYNQNIENICNAYWNAFYKYLPLWECFKTTASTMQVIPTNQKNAIIDSIENNVINESYNNGYNKGLVDGETIGFSKGQTDIVQTESTLRKFISAIFTAPSHLINSMFDFEIFGFNIASIIKTIFGLIIIGVIVTIVIKIML